MAEREYCEVVRTVHTVDVLESQVTGVGPLLLRSSQGDRAHPALVEAWP